MNDALLLMARHESSVRLLEFTLVIEVLQERVWFGTLANIGTVAEMLLVL
jgi:hypothetical protein